MAANSAAAVPDKEVLRAQVRWVVDWISHCRDKITNVAVAFAAVLFVFGGCYGGYALLYAMKGIFGIPGTILAVAAAGGLVAVQAYFDSVEENEEAMIEAQIEQEYKALKEEEQREIKKLKDAAEQREIDYQLRSKRLLQHEVAMKHDFARMDELRKKNEEFDQDEPMPEMDSSRLERLHRLRERLEALGARQLAKPSAEEPAPEAEAETEAARCCELTEPAEEPPPGSPSENAMGSSTADVLRRATLRRRAAASSSAEDARRDGAAAEAVD